MNKICFILLFTVSYGINCQNNLIDEIKERGHITVAVLNDDYFPYYYVGSNEQITGSDIDLANLLGEELGVEVRYNRSADTYLKLIELIDNRVADIIISRFPRELLYSEKVLITDPYLKIDKGLLLNRIKLYQNMGKNQNTKSFIKDFNGKIGVVKKSSDHERVKSNFIKADIVKYRNIDRCINDLLKGDILAIYDDTVNIDTVLEKNPKYLLNLQKVILTDINDYLVMAVNKNEILFKQWLDILINDLTLNLEDK